MDGSGIMISSIVEQEFGDANLLEGDWPQEGACLFIPESMPDEIVTEKAKK